MIKSSAVLQICKGAERHEHTVVSGPYDKNKAYDRGTSKTWDLVAEVVDARIPISSRNPDIDELVGSKPRIIILNRADQAEPGPEPGLGELVPRPGIHGAGDQRQGREGRQSVFRRRPRRTEGQAGAVEDQGAGGASHPRHDRWGPQCGQVHLHQPGGQAQIGQGGGPPGVTRGKQWVSVDASLDLLDTPGILWPKFEDQSIGLNLAFTGAVKDEIMDVETLACHFMDLLNRRYPGALERYKIQADPEAQGWELLERAARKRGFLVSGGEPDTERMSKILLDSTGGGKLGVLPWRRRRTSGGRRPERRRPVEKIDLWQYEREAWAEGYAAVCGCDEAGAGPLAGPVYAAAVILSQGVELGRGSTDSKKLTPKSGTFCSIQCGPPRPRRWPRWEHGKIDKTIPERPG